ncbi:hypothetical protein EVJ58_g11016, partial [Rhodofomes roseus]
APASRALLLHIDILVHMHLPARSRGHSLVIWTPTLPLDLPASSNLPCTAWAFAGTTLRRGRALPAAAQPRLPPDVPLAHGRARADVFVDPPSRSVSHKSYPDMAKIMDDWRAGAPDARMLIKRAQEGQDSVDVDVEEARDESQPSTSPHAVTSIHALNAPWLGSLMCRSRHRADWDTSARPPEEQRAPTSDVLLQTFVADLAGAYSADTIRNYVMGIRAWHILHGIPWTRDKEQLDTLLRGATKLAPSSSKRSPRQPYTPLLDHIAINDPPNNVPLFSHRVGRDGDNGGGWEALTKKVVLARVAQAAKVAKLAVLHGHSLRIGGTLEYMLRGVPFDVVKVMGRWQSDAFRIYLRKHAQILAPYLKENPEAHSAYTRYAMPPVR